MNFLEKLIQLEAESLSTDEVYEAWNTTKEQENDKLIRLVKRETQNIKTKGKKAASPKAASLQFFSTKTTLNTDLNKRQKDNNPTDPQAMVKKRAMQHGSSHDIFVRIQRNKESPNPIRAQIQPLKEDAPRPEDSPTFVTPHPLGNVIPTGKGRSVSAHGPSQLEIPNSKSSNKKRRN